MQEKKELNREKFDRNKKYNKKIREIGNIKNGLNVTKSYIEIAKEFYNKNGENFNIDDYEENIERKIK